MIVPVVTKHLDLTGKVIKKHIKVSDNTTMTHLHMKIQGLQSIIEIPPDKDLKKEQNKCSVL